MFGIFLIFVTVSGNAMLQFFLSFIVYHFRVHYARLKLYIIINGKDLVTKVFEKFNIRSVKWVLDFI